MGIGLLKNIIAYFGEQLVLGVELIYRWLTRLRSYVVYTNLFVRLS